jgi:hypothetical protein
VRKFYNRKIKKDAYGFNAPFKNIIGLLFKKGTYNMKYFFTVYKIINMLNLMTYTGVHKTTNLNDDYKGSGLYIKRALKLHGKENFKKEIIAIFDNAVDAYKLEKELVDSGTTYNLKPGGHGGWFWYHMDDDKENTKKEIIQSGRTYAFDKFFNQYHIFPNDPRILSGDFILISDLLRTHVRVIDKNWTAENKKNKHPKYKTTWISKNEFKKGNYIECHPTSGYPLYLAKGRIQSTEQRKNTSEAMKKSYTERKANGTSKVALGFKYFSNTKLKIKLRISNLKGEWQTKLAEFGFKNTSPLNFENVSTRNWSDDDFNNFLRGVSLMEKQATHNSSKTVQFGHALPNNKSSSIYTNQLD